MVISLLFAKILVERKVRVMKMTLQARQLMLTAGERQFGHSQRHGTRPLWRLVAALAGLWLVSRAALPVDQRSTIEVVRYLQPVGWYVLLAAPLMVLVLAGPIDWWNRTAAYEGRWAFGWRAGRFVLVCLPVLLLAAAPVVGHFLPRLATLPVVGNVAPWGDVRLVLSMVFWLVVYDFMHSMLALAYTSQDPQYKTELDWSVKWVLLLVQVTFAVVGILFGLLRRFGRAAHQLQKANKGPSTASLEDLYEVPNHADRDVIAGEVVDDADDAADDVEELLAEMHRKHVYADAT
ncbi:hypothetical protein IPP75_01810 [Candidatus Saccharibacteria bacterium]|nr:MAG: hypothetical protein IPP75_01810 [Candidatus Saccharibacteria bacterium]